MRSSHPPCPGSSVPLSLTPAPRFNADSHKSPIWPAIFASAANATAVCAIAASAGFLFLTTLYLQDVRGFTALQAGLTLLPMPAMMAERTQTTSLYDSGR